MTNKKNSKKLKGFTLVELIVVMVILAILAALLIPGLTRYIDKANEQSVIVEARNIAVAAQTTCSERYGKAKAAKDKTDDELVTYLVGTDGLKEINSLSEIDPELTASSFTDVVVTGGKVTNFTYDNGVYTVIYSTTGLNKAGEAVDDVYNVTKSEEKKVDPIE